MKTITTILIAIFSLGLVSHEDVGEKNINCFVSYSSESEKDSNDILYTMNIEPAISMNFVNKHIDLPVLPEEGYCINKGKEGYEVCYTWSSRPPRWSPTLNFIAETENGLSILGKFAVLNFEDPPKAKQHPTNYKNFINVTKEQYEEAETSLKYCKLIY
jgi:hypothetical protein